MTESLAPVLEPLALLERGKANAVRNPLIRAPQAADLAAPVGTVMRPTLTVETVDSLARAAGTFRENGASLLPVVEDGRLVGVLTNVGLARALGEASEPTDAVGDFLESTEILPPYATAAEALRRGEDGRTMVVADDAGRVVGLVSAVDLWPRVRVLPKPAMVGGMATPFGVYLTTGNVAAGAPWWGLMATGAAMFAMLITGQTLAEQAVRAGFPAVGVHPLTFGIFFLLMRLVPLSGTHGAEHMVVNAIEREETLSLSTVRRMPLVHPRCGTNLMVGVSIFSAVLFLGLSDKISQEEIGLRILPAVVLGVVFARPLGSIVQRFVTTKRPTDRQLEGAIQAGRELLERNATASYAASNPFRRIWSMGLLQVMSGALLLAVLIDTLHRATGWTWLPQSF